MELNLSNFIEYANKIISKESLPKEAADAFDEKILNSIFDTFNVNKETDEQVLDETESNNAINFIQKCIQDFKEHFYKTPTYYTPEQDEAPHTTGDKIRSAHYDEETGSGVTEMSDGTVVTVDKDGDATVNKKPKARTVNFTFNEPVEDEIEIINDFLKNNPAMKEQDGKYHIRGFHNMSLSFTRTFAEGGLRLLLRGKETYQQIMSMPENERSVEEKSFIESYNAQLERLEMVIDKDGNLYDPKQDVIILEAKKDN